MTILTIRKYKGDENGQWVKLGSETKVDGFGSKIMKTWKLPFYLN